jgi:acetoin utilization deacetylase AcuC-like enzyme
MPIVFALTRPPGHHACHELAGGYCYINNAAVTAEYILSKLPPPDSSRCPTQSRLVILDLDFHHGNGTQGIFYNRREPAYVSIHGKGRYPYYTGAAEEQGNGEGEGFNLNLPLESRPASNTEDYFRLLDQALNIIREKWTPEYLLVSMGFDTYCKDVLGGFELDVEDYRTIGKRIRALDLPTLVLLEGGYSEELGNLVINFVRGLASE